MANKGGPAKARYDKEYNSRSDQLKKRAMRNAARAEYEKKHGDLPSHMDVDHKRPLDKGGSNSGSNLRAVTQKENRGWREDHKDMYGKKKK